MRLALDTNILAYAEGVNGAARREEALDLLERLGDHSILIPVQAHGELFHVLTRNAGRPVERAREAILGWQRVYSAIETSQAVFVSACDLAVNHRLTIWDSIIISAAAAAGCEALLSEDLQSGFVWNGVRVMNPFAPGFDELL